MKFLVLSAFALVAVHAIPLKRDDMPERIKAADEDSSRGLDEFVRAFNEGDKQVLFEESNFIIDIAKRGQDHSEAFVSKFPKLLAVLKKGANSRFGGNVLVRAIAWLLDGNRDNESYYDLETVIQWIQKRQDKGVQDEDLSTALAAAKESQQHLQNMAGTFVQGIKQIRKEPSTMKQTVDHIIQTVHENEKPFLDKYQETMDALYNYRNTQSV